MKSGAADEIETQKREQPSAPEVLWFVARGHVLKGPFSTEEIQLRVKKKEVSFLDFCWRQGFREWRPIGSVEDFDRRGRLRALPEYPPIPVPGGGAIKAPETAPVNSHPTRREADKQKKFQVTLARNHRHSITIYEWGFAAIFALVFAYSSVHFALTEVQQSVLARLSVLEAGVRVDLRTNADALPPGYWTPLFSAPSFSDFAKQSTYDLPAGVEPLLNLTVRIAGNVVGGPKGEPTLDGFSLSDMPLWARARHLDPNVDPVYVRPRAFSGWLPVRSPASMQIDAEGEPYLKH